MDQLLYLVNHHVVDPLLGHTYDFAHDPETMRSLHPGSYQWNPEYSFARQFFVLWAFIYLSGYLMYIIVSGCTYLSFYSKTDKKNLKYNVNDEFDNVAYWKFDKEQIKNEIWVSTWSLFIMAGMTTPVEMLPMMGYGFVYHNISDYGYLYFFLSPFLFLIFTDTLIYWIHRLLHHPTLYWIHKLHHKYKETTPFSAFHFHPLDGYAQGLPYHLFVLFFPFHSILYAVSLMMVGLWTINIHDRMTLKLYGVNGAAHHTIHHTKFNYNYGQYFTFWDRFYNTHKDPYVMWPYTEKKSEKSE